jgi:hypothetical protein
MKILSGLIEELERLLNSFRSGIKTREFWIYVVVIGGLLLIALPGTYLAAGFDPLTRGQLRLGFSCRTGEKQIGTIIVGVFVFGLACVFTLGEVVHWVEEYRLGRGRSRRRAALTPWRPIAHVLGTIALGVGGYFLMSTWCT